MRLLIFSIVLLFLAASCKNVECLNGGVNVDGDCNCPVGYSGDNCGDQITPSRIKIESVTIHEFSDVDQNGVAWDPDGPADLMIRMFTVDANFEVAQFLIMSTVIEDADPNSDHFFDFSQDDVYIDAPNFETVFQFYDFDVRTNERVEMGGLSIPLYEDNNDFIETLEIKADAYPDFTVAYKYEF